MCLREEKPPEGAGWGKPLSPRPYPYWQGPTRGSTNTPNKYLLNEHEVTFSESKIGTHDLTKEMLDS